MYVRKVWTHGCKSLFSSVLCHKIWYGSNSESWIHSWEILIIYTVNILCGHCLIIYMLLWLMISHVSYWFCVLCIWTSDKLQGRCCRNFEWSYARKLFTYLIVKKENFSWRSSERLCKQKKKNLGLLQLVSEPRFRRKDRFDRYSKTGLMWNCV